MIQHATEPLTARDAAAVGCVLVRRHNQLVAEALVIAFGMIVRDEFRHELAQMTSPNGITLAKHSRRAEPIHLSAYAFKLGLRDGSRSGFTPLFLSMPRTVTEQRVSIHDDATMLEEEAVDGVREVARHLLHVRLVRLLRDSGNFDTSAREVDHEQHVEPNQPGPRDCFHCEEVRRIFAQLRARERRRRRHGLRHERCL